MAYSRAGYGQAGIEKGAFGGASEANNAVMNRARDIAHKRVGRGGGDGFLPFGGASGAFAGAAAAAGHYYNILTGEFKQIRGMFCINLSALVKGDGFDNTMLTPAEGK